MSIIYNLKNKKGVTLIEVVVALGIFSVVSTIAINVFATTLQTQRKVFNAQLVQENGRYLMESVSKEIRTSKVNSSTGQSSSLNITNSKGQDVNYVISGGQLLRNGEVLNSSRAGISGYFFVNKGTDIQPSATIAILIKSKGNGQPSQQSSINLQTTVSSRSY